MADLTLTMFGDPRLPTQFWERVFIEANGCWKWSGSITTSGYGMVPWHTSYPASKRAHRAAYLALVAPIPEGLVLDHLCRNRDCVNPDHLEVVTIRENTLRGDGPAAINARAVVCSTGGHPLSGENLYVNPRGARCCRTCINARRRARRAEARSATT